MPSLQKSVVPASINVSIIDCAGVRFIFYFGGGNNLVLQPLIIPHCIMNWPGAVDMHVQSLSQKEKKMSKSVLHLFRANGSRAGLVVNRFIC
jgi:hypothetical protein